MPHPYNDDTNTLVALLKEPSDWQIVQQHGIYRIRGSLRYPPTILTEKRVQLLGFYLPAKFGAHKFSVRHYARVRKISMAPRHECVPGEPRNARSEDLYYKIEVYEPEALAEPIVSLRGRSHMVLIQTSEKRLFEAYEFNFLYKGSKLEELMWHQLLQHNIYAEREYPVRTRGDSSYFLDFAVFCKNGKLAIEMDGDQHQSTRDAVIYDNRRDNNLLIDGWETFRYAKEDIAPDRLKDTLSEIGKAIIGHGGLKTEGGILPNKPLLEPSGQTSLFHDEHLNFLALRKRVKERYAL